MSKAENATKAIGNKVFVDTSGLELIATTAKRRAMTMKACKQGAKLIQQAAKARAPRRTRSGALKQSLGVKTAKGTRGKTLGYAVVGPRKKVVKFVPRGKSGKKVKAVPAFYAHLVEGGTRPHSLGKGAKLARTKKVQGKESKDIGQDSGKKHPGARPKPFLKPAFDSTIDQAIAVAQQSLLDQTQTLIKQIEAKKKAQFAKMLDGA